MIEDRKTALIAQLEALDEKLTREAEASLEAFVRQAWSVIEPHTPFVDGWHIGAICRHLEAVIAGELRQLLLLVPPRMTKSICASICLTPWAWIKRPGLRFMFASYAANLAVEHAVTSRRLIESAWYQDRWGANHTLTTDQNIKSHYENSHRGARIATSIEGGATGRGCDILVLDDPHNLRNIYSEAERYNVRETFYKRAWHNRVNNEETAGRICIMQRGHPDDLATFLQDIGYETLLLPNEYDPQRSATTSIGWCDPRRERGALLCPERFSAEATVQMKRVAPSDYQAQYQQDPMPAEGRMFQRSWFRIVGAAPVDVVAWVRFWDVAGTEGGGGARTAGVKMGRTAGGHFVVADVTKGRWTEQGVDRQMAQAAALDGAGVAIREEQEPGSSGLAVIRARARLLAGHDYRGLPASGDKVTRARPLRSQAEAGNVDLVARDAAEAERVREFLDELETFPFGLKDQVDAAAGALNCLTLADRGELGLLFADGADVEDLAGRVARAKADLGITGE